MNFSTVSSVFGVVKSLKGDIDLNPLSFVHILSSAMFCLLSASPAAYKYFNSNIECMSSLDAQVANSYCLIDGNFTKDSVSKEDIRYHQYYIWVPFSMFSCAFIEHIGRWVYYYALWGSFLNRYVKQIKSDMKENPDLGIEDLKIMLTQECVPRNSVLWVFSFFVMEVINFVIPLVQFFCLNELLNGHFLMLGFNVFKVEVLSEIFPVRVKCTFRRSGPSGAAEIIDALCVLVLSPFHAKIFLITWYWVVLMILLQIVKVFQFLVIFISLKRTRLFPSFCSNFRYDQKIKTFHLSVVSELSFCSTIYCSYILKNINFEIRKMLTENSRKDYGCAGETKPMLSPTEGDFNQNIDVISVYAAMNRGKCSLLYVSYNAKLIRVKKVFSGCFKFKHATESEPFHFKFTRNGSQKDCMIQLSKKSKFYVYFVENNGSWDVVPPKRKEDLYFELDYLSSRFMQQKVFTINLLSDMRSLGDENYDFLDTASLSSANDNSILFSCKNDLESDSKSQPESVSDDLTALIHTTADGQERVDKTIPVLVH